MTIDRLQLAAEALNDGRADDALDDLVWFWEHGDPLRRVSELIEILAVAIELSEKVRAHFAALRDATTPATGKKGSGVADWLALNEALGEPQRSLAWFDALVARGETPIQLLSRLRALLIARGRVTDLLHTVKDPVAEIAQWLGTDENDAFRDDNRLEAALLFKAIEAGRPELVGAARAALRTRDDTPELQALLSASFEELARRLL